MIEFFENIQRNAVAFSREVDWEGFVDGKKKPTPMTQEKAAFNEEIDEEGANVATADSGAEENLYADEGPSLFNDEEDDFGDMDEDPKSRSSAGTEDEFAYEEEDDDA